ncbi:MAG TPA: NAD(P)H-binding protein, partial [Burkholderiaceae bacterium]
MDKKRKKLDKPRLLIVGCGDVGMRLLPHLCARYRVFALVRRPEQAAALRAAGAIPVAGDLDQPHTLHRLGGLARRVVHLAPPQGEGKLDRRTRNLTAILPDRATLVYVSTSGVYGDCQG